MLALKPTAVICVVFACALGVAASGASAQPLEILHSFTACLPSGECPIDNDGSYPGAAMVRGSDDNFYGVANGGAGGAFGSIYRINSADGTYTVLHRFVYAGGPFSFLDGCSPVGRLAEGLDGAFYGVASGCGISGDGTIFKITTAGVFTKVHDLDDGDVNTFPQASAGLTRGTDGNFYGTTRGGGEFGMGSVFKITPAGVFATLHSFNGVDGKSPIADLALAADGTLYGTTSAGALGGASCYDGCGTVFGVTNGTVETVYELTPDDGWSPSGVVEGTDGHLYGTVASTEAGPAVFRATTTGAFTTVALLRSSTASTPTGGLVIGADGNFYGVGSGGFLNVGTIFRMTPAGVLSTVHTFTGADGSRPTAALALGPGGRLYGSTYQGGTEDFGTLFRILPAAPTHAILDVNVFGTGSITSVPAGIGCANSCWASFPLGTVVTLEMLPAPGAIIQGLFGCVPASATTCTLTINSNWSVFAQFSTVGAPAVQLTPAAVAFDIQKVGTQSVTQKVVQLTNTGTAALQFGSFNGQPPTANFTLNQADFQVQTNCPLAFGLPPGDSCDFTFRFRPTSDGQRDSTLYIFFPGIFESHQISVTGRGFFVDEFTVTQLVGRGGSRLQFLQNLDGGWYFNVTNTDCGLGLGVSCPNTIGVTGLGLIAAYQRTFTPSLLDAAWEAGDLLIDKFNEAMLLNPQGLPKLQDVEFLKALSDFTSDQAQRQLYYDTAYNWFGVLADQFTAPARVDALFASRAAGGRRAVGAWDSASLIRAAKAVGYPDYAQAAATRVVELELDWKDTDPSHQWDVCVTPGGCGTPDNRFAYDDTLTAMGSLLWGIHDIPGFDAQIVQYRAHLLASQDPAGSWDAGDSQRTAYAMFGLAAVGGPGTAAAIRKAAEFFIVNELPTGGWPRDVSPTGNGVENTEVDAEIARGLATLFNTYVGTDVLVSPSQLASVEFSSVARSGETTMVTSNPAVVPTTGGFQIYNDLMYEITTSATISGDITVCFYLHWIPDEATFAAARILHGENGTLVDRTILAPDPLAPDFGSRRMCALVTSLSPFAIGIDRTAPKLSVELTPQVLHGNNHKLVTITARVRARDAKDPSPAITLLSITSSEADAGLGKKDLPGDIQEARIGSDDRVFKLRNESFGKKRNRIYTVVYRATDRSGNHRDVTVDVRVKGEK